MVSNATFGEANQRPTTRAIKAGVLYFVIVFAVGFALAPVRELWAVPRFGERLAELMEMPLMFVVIVLAARWTVQHLDVPIARTSRLVVGGIALGLLVLSELGVVFWVRGLSLDEYVASRDPVAGTVYVVILLVFAAVPLVVSRQ